MSDGKAKPPLRSSAVPPRASASPPRPSGLPRPSARPSAAPPRSQAAAGLAAQPPRTKAAPPAVVPASEPTMHTAHEHLHSDGEDDGAATVEAMTVQAAGSAATVDDGVEALDEGLEDLSADAVSENSREIAGAFESAEYAMSDDLDNAPTHHRSKPLPSMESGTMPLQNVPLAQRAPNLFMPSATPPPQRVQPHSSLPPTFRPMVESADSFEPPPRTGAHHEELEWRPGVEGNDPPVRAERARPRARSFEEGQFTGTPHEQPLRGRSLPSFSDVTHDPFAPTGIRRRLPVIVAAGLLLLIALAAIGFLRS